MPSKDGKIWRGIVTINRKKHQKVFKTKAEAVAWEDKFRLARKIAKNSIQLRKEDQLAIFGIQCENKLQLEAKYKHMLESPQVSLIDVLDEFFKDFSLPYKFTDIVNLVNYSCSPAKANRKPSAGLRTKVFQRDGYKCKLCGKGAPETSLEIDHILPCSKGGLTEERNLRTLCIECNRGLGNSFHLNSRVIKRYVRDPQ